MDVDPVRRYVNALRERNRAERVVRGASEFIKFVSNALERAPTNIQFDGQPRFGPFSPRADGFNFDSKRWPSAKQLHELIIEWDRTRKEVAESWDALPKEDRQILPSPEQKA